MSQQRALALARVQDGLISRQQVFAAGMSTSALRHAIRPGGSWQRVLPGVYATFSGQLAMIHRLRAALLHAGVGALVTGPAACAMIGLTYGPDVADTVDVLVDHGVRRRDAGFVHVLRTTRMPEGRRWIDEDRLKDLSRSGPPLDTVLDELAPTSSPGVIPMAPPARAIVDTVVRLDRLPVEWQQTCPSHDGCARCRYGWSHRDEALRNVRAVLCEVVQRRRASVAELRDEVAAAPRRGSALARLALADIVAGCRSAPECELRDLVRASRVLPEPRWNQPLPGQRGIYPDACWPEARLVVEVDSRSYHGFGDAPERTEQRRARYAALGWRVLPVSPARLRSEPQAVLREIEVAYMIVGSLVSP